MVKTHTIRMNKVATNSTKHVMRLSLGERLVYMACLSQQYDKGSNINREVKLSKENGVKLAR